VAESNRTQEQFNAKFISMTGGTRSFEQMAIRQQLRLLSIREADDRREAEQRRRSR
jgi:hypothetical protein